MEIQKIVKVNPSMKNKTNQTKQQTNKQTTVENKKYLTSNYTSKPQ